MHKNDDIPTKITDNMPCQRRNEVILKFISKPSSERHNNGNSREQSDHPTNEVHSVLTIGLDITKIWLIANVKF